MELAIMNQPVTMSSLELVSFINDNRQEGEAILRHDSFMAKVPNVLGEGVQKYLDTYIHPQNSQKYLHYLFPKREACLMAMSYSYELQAKVFDKMTELENQLNKQEPRFQIPNTLAGALRLAAEQAEELEKQALLIEQQKPAVEFVSRYVEAKSTKAISDVAKILGVKRNVFIEWLVERQYIFKRSGNYLPYAEYEKYFEVKTGEAHGHAYHQTKFNCPGIAWVSSKWNKAQGN